MTVAEYIAKTIADAGIRHVFTVAGGSSLFLLDAMSREPRLTLVHCHHEQACAMAADAYYRVNAQMACVCVTSGPGGLNALNGVFGAWVDSIPMLVISGQVRRDTMRAIKGCFSVRQLGDQECDITHLAAGMSKFCHIIDAPELISKSLDLAIFEATYRRGGPTWLDVPVDVQTKPVGDDPERFTPIKSILPVHNRTVSDVIGTLVGATSPVIIAGTGVRLAGAVPAFRAWTTRLGIPVVTAWNHDTMNSDHPCFIGRQGTLGDRAANIVTQNADVLLILGSRMGIRHTGYSYKQFAPKACKIWVDLAENEMMDKPTIKADMPIVADVLDFINAMPTPPSPKWSHWLQWCMTKRIAYQSRVEQDPRKQINPYFFLSRLWNNLRDDDVVVCADATATIVTGHVAFIRGEQRLLSNSGCASMGWDLPAAIGAAVARGGKRVICLAGDGSIQLNIQELATIRQHDLPIKLFVLNNGGYLSIRASQQNLTGKPVGESADSGLFFPELGRLANAYSIPFIRLASPRSLNDAIATQLEDDRLFMTEVVLDPAQGFEPRMQTTRTADGQLVSSTFENMYPFLSEEEQASNVYKPE